MAELTEDELLVCSAFVFLCKEVYHANICIYVRNIKNNE